MKRVPTVLLFLVNAALMAQISPNQGNVYYSLKYQPGDWITISTMRYATSVASSYRMAYVGTSGGVFRYDLNKKKIYYPLTTSNGLLDNDVRLVAVDPQNEFLWVATKQGLQYYSTLSERFSTARYVQIGVGIDEEILSIGFSGGKVWLQTTKGYLLSQSNSSMSFFREDAPIDAGIRWFGKEGLIRTAWPGIAIDHETGFFLDAACMSIVDQEFRKAKITYYAYDYLGGLWIATDGAGIWRAAPVSLIAEPLVYGLAMEDVSAISIDGLTMWIGGNLDSPLFRNYRRAVAGITHWNQEVDRFDWYDSGFRSGIKADYVTEILPDSEWIWIGTHEGLMRKSRTADYWSLYGQSSGLYHPRVYCLTTDSINLYIGTQSGLNKVFWSGNDYIVARIELPALFNVSVYKMLYNQGKLWMTTNQGIFSLDLSNQILRQFNALGYEVRTGSLLNQEIRGVCEDNDFIYFASSRGVVRYGKADQQWISIPLNLDYLSPGVNDADGDEDNVWIATNRGALRLIKATNKWIYYSTNDGLGGERVRSVLVDDDYVWFGTQHGLTQFHWGAEHLKD
ncbi:MAG: hypothetical protein KDC45_00720 [Bacteroidetes bacterium]|nr:hypothetical protein [Bacteroidota bacterium]